MAEAIVVIGLAVGAYLAYKWYVGKKAAVDETLDDMSE